MQGKEDATEGSSRNELPPLLSYDEDGDDLYDYDSPDLVDTPPNSKAPGSNRDGKNHRQDHQTRISNNFTPGGSGHVAVGGSGTDPNNRLSSNSNNNINNGRHSRKSYSATGTSGVGGGNSNNNNLAVGKNRESNNPNDHNRFGMKTVVVSLSPNGNGLPGRASTSKYHQGMHTKFFFAIYLLCHLHFLPQL